MSSNAVGILIIIAIIVIAVITGGAIFTGDGTRNGTSTSTAATSSLNKIQKPLSPEEQERSLADEIKKISEKIEKLKADIKKTEEDTNASVYKGKVEISSVSKAGTPDAYVKLSAASDISGTIKITGWKLRSTATGYEQIIGGAASPPYPFVFAESPILLPKLGKIVISQRPSPINVSFRVNKCTGYFEEDEDFSPALEKICPAPKDDRPAYTNSFEVACIDYIKNLSRCEVPDENDFPNTLNYGCRQYLLTEINYNKCVEKHINDPDFFKPEWRVFPPWEMSIWRSKYETIELLDSLGKVVDTYSY